MENPLAAIEHQLDQIRRDVERSVHIAILRETAVTALTRLVALDSAHAVAYQEACARIESAK